ncbi:hypothetical protein JCM19235_4173 [Vibrio maritimus]|uniref:Uncharacterized protein n=1 Tax=Vibrio maritimus TaxID=990268 RepID=A0A090RZN5_9VIBR|nr:hypothetical protein JCM19235_4173 [Vibrio maritimus]
MYLAIGSVWGTKLNVVSRKPRINAKGELIHGVRHAINARKNRG